MLKEFLREIGGDSWDITETYYNDKKEPVGSSQYLRKQAAKSRYYSRCPAFIEEVEDYHDPNALSRVKLQVTYKFTDRASFKQWQDQNPWHKR